MKPLVSVVIPTYNHAHFLGRALESVISQTYQGWEALVIDNHSTDNTEELVAEFQDSRIRLLKIRNDGVIARSRNLGMQEARGDWIAFLDSDDLWYETKLATILPYITLPDSGYDVVSTDEMTVDRDLGSKQVLRYGPASRKMYRSMLLYGNRLSPSSTAVRRSFLVEHDLKFRELPAFVTVEDYDFWLNLANKGARFKFLPVVEGEYTIHSANASGDTDRHRQNLIALLKDHVFNVQQFEVDQERLWQRVYARLLIRDAVHPRQSEAVQERLRSLLSAFQLSPTGCGAYVANRVFHALRSSQLTKSYAY